MSNIRVTYSGLISLAVGLTGLITGLIFFTILTRSVSPEEIGSWRLILSLTTYVLVMESGISYWVQREIPRGENSAKTAVIASIILSLIGTIIYLIIAYIFGGQSDAEMEIFFFAVVLVLPMFVDKVLTGITFSWKPQMVSYSILLTSIVKIPIALVLVYYFELGVIGIIITFVIVHVISSVVLGIKSRHLLKNKINLEFIKKWRKLFWVPLYPDLASLTLVLDVVIVTIITGSVYGLGFYAVAMSIGRIIGNANNISKVAYPKILEIGIGSYLQKNFILFFYIAFPLASFSIVFAKPALFVLNPIYAESSILVILLTIQTFFNSLNTVLIVFLTGNEKVDIKENPKFRDYIKSKLFYLPSLRLITFSAYLVSLTIMLVMLKDISTEIDLIIYWALIGSVIHIPLLVKLLIISKKELKISFIDKRIGLYIICSIFAFGLTYFVMDNYLTYNERIFEFVPSLLIFVFLGFGIYFITTYFGDSEIKNIVREALIEIKKKK